jgi:heavy metal translocating P-type ATPase
VSAETQSCQFCGRTTADPVTDGGVFCSTGCHAASASLGGRTDDPAPVRRGIAPETDDPETGTRAFFHVTGMHSVTCEAFLEQAATDTEGVSGADASYVTETVTVTYDPETVSESDICDRLSVVGYRAVSREETSGESTAAVLAAGETRELDDLLGFRYAAGVVFGVFVLLPYVVVFYPAQFGLLQNALFAGGLSGSGGFMLVPLFVVPTTVVVLFTGLPLLRGAYVSIRLRRPNADLLAALTIVAAFVYSVVALLAGRIDLYFDLTIVVAATTVAAVFYESLVKQRAMDRLTDLTVSQAEEARVELPSGTETVAVEDLRPGDRVLVRQGERVPVDGELAAGRCTVDESVVTGESRPVTKAAGEKLVGGAVVTGDAAVVRVGDPPTSSIDRITTAVWLLQSATHGLQRRTDRLAALVVPAVLGAAALAAVVTLALGGGPFAAVLACLGLVLAGSPWGLALATPLSVATNLRAAMAHGVVVFDETVFERLRETDTVVLDKTGTLTTGEMRVASADAPDEVIDAAALLERRAAHPAGAAIVRYAETRTDGGYPVTDDSSDRTATDDRIKDFENHAWGVGGTVEGVDYLVGHPALFAEEGWSVGEAIDERVRAVRAGGQLPVVLGREGTASGVVVLDDEPREGWDNVLSRLDETGADVVVLTGDDPEAAAAFREHPAVDRAFAGIPPAGKTETVRRLQGEGHVTMVGDGTNDAPALAQADLGIALGSGTALASDAADVAIADDDLETVETTFALARAAGRRVRQNTGLALVYNLVAVPAAVAGVLNPVIAMAGIVATGGLLAANASRSLL